MSSGIDRRTFVKGAGKAAALGLAAPTLLSALAGCGPDASLGMELSGFYSDPEAAAEVGRAYLKVKPEEADRDLLLERMADEDLDRWEDLARRNPEALREAVRARHRSDFAENRVVRLHGWILSQTEVRLCALLALPSS